MKPVPSAQKLRGGYYTPEVIADFLATWAVTSADATVLEPSCGDGALLVSAVNALRRLGADDAAIGRQLFAVEINATEAAKASERLARNGIILREDHLVVDDFFACYRDRFLLGSLTEATQRYDAIIGNPPFVRYQNFPEEQRSAAFEMMRQAGLRPTRLTNSWAPFLVAATFLLEDEGRLGMVIPAELFQVSYAAEIRRFLTDQYTRITIVTFKKLVFPDILQEVVLLLCERGGNGQPGIRVVEIASAEELAALDHRAVDAVPLKPVNHSAEKWTQYFLQTNEILLLRGLLESGALTPAR